MGHANEDLEKGDHVEWTKGSEEWTGSTWTGLPSRASSSVVDYGDPPKVGLDIGVDDTLAHVTSLISNPRTR